MSNSENISILYEDDNILAVNKPAGLMVHPDGRSEGPFLTDWILQKFPETKNVGEDIRDDKGNVIHRPGIVHRLDRDTSGVMLIAKTKKGHECLKKQFQDRTIKKKYLAYVHGRVAENFGTIDLPIGRSKSDFRKWSAQRGARGELRPAETYWTKIAEKETVDDNGQIHFVTLVAAEPKTGRTHQIRVHFAAMQRPIVGDELYGPGKPALLGFVRTALHAKSIEFDNCEGKRIHIEVSEPEDFVRARG